MNINGDNDGIQMVNNFLVLTLVFQYLQICNFFIDKTHQGLTVRSFSARASKKGTV